MRTTAVLIVVSCSLSIGLWPGAIPAHGDDARPRQDGAATQSLDDALLDDLDNDLLKGLDDIPIADPGSGTDPRPGASPAGSESDRRLMQQLGEGEDLGQPAEDPLTTIGRRMRTVEELIGRRNTSESTQQLQREIINDLAAIIEQLEKQCQQGGESSDENQSSANKPSNQPGSPKKGGSGAAKDSTRPARESTDRIGQADADDARLDEMRRMLKEVWGHLPPRVREQMQSGAVERFLPEYEQLIEEYYKRLAEEPAGAIGTVSGDGR